MEHSNFPYRRIGKGFCGTVWTAESNQDDEPTAIKREDGGPDRSITNDYNMHLRVLRSAKQHPSPTPLEIPQCHALIQPTDPWWQAHLRRFPKDFSACRALVTERIPNVPRPISNKIVDLFCAGGGDAKMTEKFKTGDDDTCLIRPYLGRRRHRQEKRVPRFFSLWNVPLHMDQMEALGLDTNSYAETMVDALAMMHWGARIDANDVEFVLAPPRVGGGGRVFRSEYLGDHCMWILDFDCCRPLSMDEAGVEQACIAFFKNDSFYPRPGSGVDADEVLWRVFKQRFLVASEKILSDEREDTRCLAKKLMERIEEEGQLRRKKLEGPIH
jgi:hypothetical protein